MKSSASTPAPGAASRSVKRSPRHTSKAAARAHVRRRSPCPVACTLDLIGDRWTLLVVRDLFAGRTRFAEFQRAPEGVASNILAARLEALVIAGLVERRVAPAGGHPSYHLTARGKALGPVLSALRDFGLAHIERTAAHVAVPEPG